MDQRLIDRFYQGECTPQEVKEVLAWFQSQALTPAQEERLQEWWAQAGAPQASLVNAHDADKAWHRLDAAIRQTGSGSAHTAAATLPVRRPRSQWVKIAASLLLPLGLIWLVTSHYRNTETATGGRRMVAVQAPAGQQKTIALEDGSTIVLRAGSKVSYLMPFPAHKRAITLEGEAFFEVAKDKKRPFVVTAGTLSTQALGTSFNIRHLPNDTAVWVALATGLVEIRGPQSAKAPLAKLVPGQQLIYTPKNQRHTVSSFENREVLGWKNGVLYFKEAGLTEIITRLEEWYGVEVEVLGTPPADAQEWRYTGEYVGQSLPQVLEGIGFVKQFTYKITNKKVQLTFNRP